MLALTPAFATDKNDKDAKTVSIEMVQVKGGRFDMGEDSAATDRRPAHTVILKDFTIGKYDFDYTSQLIRWDGQQQKLSTKEADLLRLLCIKQNDVLTREEALLQIWHDDNYFNGRSMDVFLSKIRKYLKDDPSVEIVNVHGRGYKLLVGSTL